VDVGLQNSVQLVKLLNRVQGLSLDVALLDWHEKGRGHCAGSLILVNLCLQSGHLELLQLFLARLKRSLNTIGGRVTTNVLLFLSDDYFVVEFGKHALLRLLKDLTQAIRHIIVVLFFPVVGKDYRLI
jgi:hypothetical protein